MRAVALEDGMRFELYEWLGHRYAIVKDGYRTVQLRMNGARRKRWRPGFPWANDRVPAFEHEAPAGHEHFVDRSQHIRDFIVVQNTLKSVACHGHHFEKGTNAAH